MRARTEREGPTALASSILGLTPLYGMHVPEHRKPTHLIKLACKMNNDLDYALLGYWIGRSLDAPLPRIMDLRQATSHDALKGLCASMAASGSISMFLMGSGGGDEETEMISVGRNELLETERFLSSEKNFEHVALGCPHLSLKELESVAGLVSGRKVTKQLWCFTSRHVRDLAQRQGYVGAIEHAGGKVICDTCIVVSPMVDSGIGGVVTNSCKAAHYLRSLNQVETRLMDLRGCVEYAIS